MARRPWPEIRILLVGYLCSYGGRSNSLLRSCLCLDHKADGFAHGLPAARREEASVCKLLLAAVSNSPLSPYCSGELSVTSTKMTATCPSHNTEPKLVIRPDTGDFSSGKHQSSARSGIAALCVCNLLYPFKNTLGDTLSAGVMEWFLHLSGKAEEGRTYVQRCSPQVGVPAFYVYVSPCTWCPVSCSCLTSITYASNRSYSQSFCVCCHNGSLFSLARSLSYSIYTCIWTRKKGR